MKVLLLLIILFFISYFIIGIFIKKIKEKFVQPLLKEGPEHTQKIGTPTMGGVSFIGLYILLLLGYFLILLLKGNFSMEILVLLITTVGYFIIGFKDDFDKVTFKENERGLSPKVKLLLQALVGFIVVLLLTSFNYVDQTVVDTIIFGKVDFGFFYYLFVILILVSTTNATNLTDGLDGLLTSNSIISFIALLIISISQGNVNLVVSNSIFIVILFSFYLYNRNPAKIFMGDVGSLAIGAIIAINAVILKVEILFLFFVLIYLLETISVILQVSYFKYTKKKTGEGKRLFLMAPIHHHFEKKGFSEKKIVFMFCFINVVSSIVGLLIYFK